MRLLRSSLGGLAIGVLAGLIWFLIILLMPSNTPHNADGAGSYVILLFIAAIFAIGGGVVGSLIGLWVGGMYHVAMGTMSQVSQSKVHSPKPGAFDQPLDDLIG
jgi:hypothetical protein